MKMPLLSNRGEAPCISSQGSLAAQGLVPESGGMEHGLARKRSADTMPPMINTFANDLAEIRRRNPLVHNITNYVVMNFTANALLAIGASPIMAHSVEEVEEIVGLSSALVINIGTLSPRWVEGMEVAARTAEKKGVPVVLDPVGAGAIALSYPWHMSYNIPQYKDIRDDMPPAKRRTGRHAVTTPARRDFQWQERRN